MWLEKWVENLALNCSPFLKSQNATLIEFSTSKKEFFSRESCQLMYCISKVSANPCLSWQQFQGWCECHNLHFSYGESRRWGITSKVARSVWRTQSCPTLHSPTDSSPPGSFVHGILQAGILQWVAISFSRGSSWPRDQTQVSCTARRFFTICATRETHVFFEWLWDYILVSAPCYWPSLSLKCKCIKLSLVIILRTAWARFHISKAPFISLDQCWLIYLDKGEVSGSFKTNQEGVELFDIPRGKPLVKEYIKCQSW